MYSDLKQRVLPLIYDVTSPTGKEIVAILDEYEERMKGCIEWSKEDMIGQAAQAQNPWEMDEDTAQAALEDMIDNADCSLGVSWDTVDYYVQKHRPAEEEEEDESDNENDTQIPENRQGEINPER